MKRYRIATATIVFAFGNLPIKNGGRHTGLLKPSLVGPLYGCSSMGTDKLTRRPGLALLDRDLSALYVDASAHSERVLRSKDARRSHISEQK